MEHSPKKKSQDERIGFLEKHLLQHQKRLGQVQVLAGALATILGLEIWIYHLSVLSFFVGAALILIGLIVASNQYESMETSESTYEEHTPEVEETNIIHTVHDPEPQKVELPEIPLPTTMESSPMKVQEPLKEVLSTVEIVAEKKEEVISKSHDEATENFSLEARIGMKWTSILGIFALVFGVGFFILYAFDAGWISYTVRLLMAVLVGVGLMFGGYVLGLKEQYKNLGRTLMAGGFAIIYFTTYASYYFEAYRMETHMSETIVSLLLGLIVTLGTWTALRMNSKILVSEGYLLGYLTVFLSTNFSYLALTYCFLLSLSLILITYYKKWMYLGMGGMLLTYLTFFITNGSHTYSLLQGGSFLTLFFVTFCIQQFLGEKDTQEVHPAYASGTALNGVSYATLMLLSVLQGNSMQEKGFFLLILALFYLVQAMVSKKMHKTYLYDVSLYLSIFFVTLSLSYFFEGASLGSTIVLESLLGLGLYHKTRETPWKISSLILGAGVLAYTFFELSILFTTSSSLLTLSTGILSILSIGMSFCFYWYFSKVSKLPSPIPYYYSALGVLLTYLFSAVLLRPDQVLQIITPAWISLFLLFITKQRDIFFRYTNTITTGFLGVLSLGLFFSTTPLSPLITDHNLTNVLLLLGFLIPTFISTLILSHHKESFSSDETYLHVLGFIFQSILLYVWLYSFTGMPLWYPLPVLGVALFMLLPLLLPKTSSLFPLVAKYILGSFLLLGIKVAFDLYGVSSMGYEHLLRGALALAYILPASFAAYKLSLQEEEIQKTTHSEAYILSWMSAGMYLLWTSLSLKNTPEYFALVLLATATLFIIFSKKSWKSLYYEAFLFYGIGVIGSMSIPWDKMLTAFHVAFLGSIFFSYVQSFLWKRTTQEAHKFYAQVTGSMGSFLTVAYLWSTTESFMISASWAGFALLLILFGLKSKDRLYRWHGIILFAVTILKIILMDMNNLDPLYRILSFIALGVLLLLTSFFYTKNREKFKDYL